MRYDCVLCNVCVRMHGISNTGAGVDVVEVLRPFGHCM